MSFSGFNEKAKKDSLVMKESVKAAGEAKTLLKPNPSKNFKYASEFSDAERRQIEEKMEKDPVSLEVDRLIDTLSLSAEEMQDERTRYILGHDNCHKSALISSTN